MQNKNFRFEVRICYINQIMYLELFTKKSSKKKKTNHKYIVLVMPIYIILNLVT